MKVLTSSCALLGVLVWVGCEAEFPLSLLDATTGVDAAVVDASTQDAETVDGGGADAAVDAAVVDGAVDAGAGCGNGTVETGEECDDGDTDPGDGCDGSCVEEAGWSCTGSPSVCTTTCGDGIVAGSEVCDDNNQINGDGCSDTCVVDCTNSSTTDCNATGQTLNAGAAFVDPDPPAGFVQCAGFENTTQNDVGPHWDGNCLGAVHTLRVRYWDTSTATWTLLGDATLSPDSAASFTAQLFSATNEGGTTGFLETGGLTLLADDPAGAALPATDWTCTQGPANKHYGATDLYFARQANDRLVLVSGYSGGDDGGALSDDEDEIVRYNLTYEECTNNAPGGMRDLAIAIYLQR